MRAFRSTQPCDEHLRGSAARGRDNALSRLTAHSVVWRARGDMHSDPPKPRREMDWQNQLGFDKQRCGFRMKKPRFVAGL